MRLKLIAIFFISFIAFLAILVWRSDQIMFKDKLAWNEAQSRSLMSAFIHSIDTEIRTLQDNSPRVKMTARLQPDEQGWQILDSQVLDSEIQSWALPYTKLALKSVKRSELKENSTLLFSILDPKRKAYLLLLSRHNDQWAVKILGAELFQSLIDRQRGQLNQISVVNSQGQILGHLVPEYVGSLLTGTVQTEISQGLASSGHGVFANPKGEQEQNLFEQVGRSNVFVVITTPIEALLKDRGSFQAQFWLLGFGLLMVALGVLVLTYKPEKETLQAPVPMAAAPVKNKISAPLTKEEKLAAYTQVASALSLELKGPVTSILAHAQLARKEESDVNEHLHKIEEEARSTRQVIQKLLTFSGEDKNKKERVSLESVIHKAIKSVEGKMLSKGIKINKSLHSNHEFVMSADLVAKAIEAILLNAMEALERSVKKEINISLLEYDGKLDLMIADSGEGISAEHKEKIFDPFYTSKGADHLGLGLAMAAGVLRDMNATMDVQSELGQGTTITMQFSPSAQNAMSESVMAMPKDLPLAPAQEIRAIEEKAVLEGKPVVPVSPIIVDNSIEMMIDENLDIESSVAFMTNEAEMPPPQPITAEVISGFSSKVDRPSFEAVKRSSRLDEVAVPVRRPGASV